MASPEASQEQNVEEGKEPIKEEQSPKPFYCKVRWLGAYSKLCGTFPLDNAVFNRDGRKLKFCPLSAIYGLIVGSIFIFWYFKTCVAMIEDMTNEDYALVVWLTLNYYAVVVRGIVQFVLVHVYSSRLPKMFAAFEEYYQFTGVSIIQKEKHPTRKQWESVIATLIILILVQTTSFLFFRQFNYNMTLMQTWPMAMSYMLANVWKELPLDMFIKLCFELTKRLREVRERVKQLRKCGEKDVARDLEIVRLQHAALLRLVNLLQESYGMQLAANVFFMIIETVIQLFVFFVLTYSENFMLLLLAMYYILECIFCLTVVERLQRTDEHLVEEIAEFELNLAPREQQIQIQLFTTQIAVKPVRISASGFFNVNNALFGTILGAIASYLVMTVQFAPYIQSILENITSIYE